MSKTSDEQGRAESRNTHSGNLLSNMDPDLGPIARAMEIQFRCASVGFDWNEPSGARAKVLEEIAELDEAVAQGDREHIDSEAGDVILAVLNWVRLLGVDPTRALTAALDRFESRFALVERAVEKSGKTLEDTSLEELEAAWQAAKRTLEPMRKKKGA